MEYQIKEIVGFEGQYEVDTNGDVWSIKFGRRKKKSQFINNRGYLLVSLCKDGKPKTCAVHRLVAETFIDNPNNLPEVNHKDEDKTNNNVENLEFCDRRYNLIYSGVIEKAVKAAAKAKSKTVIQLTKDGKFVAEYPSAMEAERQTGIWQTSITNCCNYNRKSAGKYKWKYKE